MSFIDDLKKMVDNYETDHCTTEIVEFLVRVGGDTVPNVGEVFSFKVKVTNKSHLDMRSVRVRATGTSYADVALNPGPWGSSAVSSPLNIDAHHEGTTKIFRGKCKRVTNGAKDIVTVRIESWDASLDHILRDHSGPGAAEVTLNKEILPD